MFFTTNIFVASLLQLSVHGLTSSLPFRASVKRQLFKLVITFFSPRVLQLKLITTKKEHEVKSKAQEIDIYIQEVLDAH